MVSGSAVQTKGLASVVLCSSMKRRMASWSSRTERQTPSLRRRRVRLAKTPSSAFSHALEVGVTWKVQRGWRASQDLDVLVLVSGVVVEDGMDRDAGGYRARDAVEESQELLMAMPTGVLADDRAGEHGQGGKQRRRAVAPGIMCHGGAAAFLQRQARLCAVKCLTVRRVIDRQHDRVSRRRNGEADDVGQRLEAGGIVRKRERPPAVRHQAMRLPDRPYRRSGTPTAFAIARSVQWVAA